MRVHNCWPFVLHHPELDLLIVSLALIIFFVLIGLLLTTVMSNRRSVKLVHDIYLNSENSTVAITIL